ncbi:YifB family Mg chelatase-like AAA ATPase [Reinekea thalattae]|uniref:YifB family Mg chelatase-like AAA ATPase n=1 Tax=Reinekea thalattae TaxID=2593301 RepID=A0A5C8ZCK6_9GAMM|nr:YifB family Mg chelatase-like AAA ATPase [Reinekea thalattae]TXR54580.1 YifB family Mg chelatase-like AAA ATPase [Reinekea thalattae]
MSLAISYCRAHNGMEAPLVTIEVHLSSGLPAFSIVGLPEAAVREARERVRSAILNSQYDFPNGRLTVNMAPADLPKQGGQFDLAIALGILAASDQLDAKALKNYEWLAELSLSGDLRKGPGALPAAIACQQAGRVLVCSPDNAVEAALVTEGNVFAAQHLLQVTRMLRESEYQLSRPEPNKSNQPLLRYPDLADVKGQKAARRALEIAAAGRHNLLLFGPPGTGKTLLASRLPSILPPLSEAEAIEIAAVQSVANLPLEWHRRPYRAPHHTASAAALIGGGSNPKPGEVTLAHKGVLFLDEISEFPRQVLDVLREPLESHEVCISRARRQSIFPANFQLVAAMNPTPGGYAADDPRSSRYTKAQIQKYVSRLSGPFLDRIDLHIEVPSLPKEVLMADQQPENSEQVRQRVVTAWQAQISRQGCTNSELKGNALDQHCVLGDAERQLLDKAMDKLGLSARAYHRLLRVARTIADLNQQPQIDRAAIIEALNCRQLERLIG